MSDLDKQIDKMTEQVINHMKNIGAVRKAENEIPGKDFEVVFWDSDVVGVVGLEELFNIPSDLHSVILNRMILKGYDPVQTTAGLYLGKPGEEALEMRQRMAYIRTSKASIHGRIMALAKVEKLPAFRRRCQLLNLPVKGFLNSLKVDGAALPEEAETVLLEAPAIEGGE